MRCKTCESLLVLLLVDKDKDHTQLVIDHLRSHEMANLSKRMQQAITEATGYEWGKWHLRAEP